MTIQHISVQQAYGILELDEDAGVEELKAAYKKAAFSTHPDKNPGDPDATARFQEVGAAYETLLKHFENPSSASSDSGYFFDDTDMEDAEYFFYMFDRSFMDRGFVFERIFMDRFMQHRHHSHPSHRRHDSESEEELQERLRKQREERKLAAERDMREREARKQRIREQQEQDKLKAEQKRKEQAIQKKAKDEETRRNKEKVVRDQKEQAQRLRSSIFTAARKCEDGKVKKGIWENNVDAAGGEVKIGSEEFLNPEDLPKDPHETLLHIAASKGNKDLVEWLVNHNAEPEEKDSKGLTAFHIALKEGHSHVVNYFISSLPASQDDYESIYAHPPSTNNLRLALETADPELVWTILEHKLAKSRHISDAWTWFCSADGEDTLRRKLRKRGLGGEEGDGKMEEILNLLMTYGKFTPPPTPKIGLEKTSNPNDAASKRKFKKSAADSPVAVSPLASAPILQNPTPSASPAPSDHSLSSHHNYSGYSGSPSPSPSHTPHNGYVQPAFSRGRGRGRGKARGRGRGRGGFSQATSAPTY